MLEFQSMVNEAKGVCFLSLKNVQEVPQILPNSVGFFQRFFLGEAWESQAGAVVGVVGWSCIHAASQSFGCLIRHFILWYTPEI